MKNNLGGERLINAGKIIFILGVAVLAAPPLYAEEPLSIGKEISCKGFVQDFYDWYLKIYTADNKVPAAKIAMEKQPGIFSSELFQALENDFKAQALATDGISGIDFDPFLDSQDAPSSYKVIKTVVDSSGCVAEVRGVGPDWRHKGQKLYAPRIKVMLRYRSRKWVVVNFRYFNRENSSTDNLLGQLKWWVDIRKKSERK
jgi:hypothetical protein